MVIRNQQVQTRERQFTARKQSALNSKNSKNQTVNHKLDRLAKPLNIRSFILQLSFLSVVFVALLLTQFSKNPSVKTSSQPVIAASTSKVRDAQPVDQLTAVNIAAIVAQEADLSVAPIVTNQADSLKAQAAMRQNSSSDTLAKPQALATVKQGRNKVINYKVKKGENVANLAKKFDISTDTIMWANSLNSNNLIPGQSIKILPVDGVLYTVAGGDTADSIASKFASNANLIVSYNDAEITGLKPNKEIIIPNGVKPNEPEAQQYSNSYDSDSSDSAYTIGSFNPVYTGNGYSYGYCTWYVASMINVPNNWGNANTWAYYASITPGWKVSSTPTVGSIAQTALGGGGAGHVAVVSGVSADRSQVTITEMNGPAGWNVVGGRTVSAGSFVYISR